MRSLTCEQMTKTENLSPVLKEKLRKNMPKIYVLSLQIGLSSVIKMLSMA